MPPSAEKKSTHLSCDLILTLKIHYSVTKRCSKLGNTLLQLDMVYSCGDADREPRILSTTHGGFDNDPATLNDILKQVLGRIPTRDFLKKDLAY